MHPSIKTRPGQFRSIGVLAKPRAAKCNRLCENPLIAYSLLERSNGNLIRSKRVLWPSITLIDAMTIKLRFEALSAFVRRLRRRSSPDIGEFNFAVCEVIAARLARAMTGKLSAAEARLMVAEKHLAAARAQFAYMDAVSNGDPTSALGAYFDVYQRAVEGNRRRLGKRGWRWFWHGRRPRLNGLFIGALVFLSAQWGLTPHAYAQEIDFGQIDKFESLGTGTLQVGAAPKIIVDDGDQHTVILTIWEADAETKVYWTSPDDKVSRTTIVPGKGLQTFQTAGEFRLEAIGEPNHEVQYGYVLLHLRKHKAGI